MRGKDIRIRMDVSDCQDRQSPSPLSDENETDEHEQNLRKYGGTVPFPREIRNKRTCHYCLYGVALIIIFWKNLRLSKIYFEAAPS